jgi:hypothetical protein
MCALSFGASLRSVQQHVCQSLQCVLVSVHVFPWAQDAPTDVTTSISLPRFPLHSSKSTLPWLGAM